MIKHEEKYATKLLVKLKCKRGQRGNLNLVQNYKQGKSNKSVTEIGIEAINIPFCQFHRKLVESCVNKKDNPSVARIRRVAMLQYCRLTVCAGGKRDSIDIDV